MLFPATKGKSVTYINARGGEISFPRKMVDEAMHAAQVWKLLDATPFHDPNDAGNKIASAWNLILMSSE